MSTRFPVASYKEIAKVAKKLGFYCCKRKTRGSHEVWKRKSDKRFTTLTNHGNKPLK